MKKTDIILLISILLISGLLLFFTISTKNSKGNTVVVKQDNIIVYKDSLYINKTVKLKGNTIKIKDGTVFVSHANCKNQICVNHKPISKKNETIICVPNKVYIEIE